MLKNHSCGELQAKDVGKEVTLAGWVHRRRDHGGLIFIDLRDREGIVQLVFDPVVSEPSHNVAKELRPEYVVRVRGEVARRPPGTENPRLPTGEIEVRVHEATLLNSAKTPAFNIAEDIEVEENLRLKYRYLYLRRSRMKNNLLLRHRAVKFMRDFLDAKGFVEIETPILIKSTPEGARDYLVPSRLNPGKFYALPQSPQQLKQILMVAGFEKYFQIARCFRDEDLRADRQPEFTQLDLEMSFVAEEDILCLMEELLTSLVGAVAPQKRVLKSFPRLSFAEAMARYGTDKPDLRFGLEIRDLSDIAAQSTFNIFYSAIQEKGVVKGMCIPGGAAYSQHQLDELGEIVRAQGAKGLITLALDGAGKSAEELTMEMVRSVAAKFLTLDKVKEIARRFEANLGDLILIVAGRSEVVSKALAELRSEMGKRLNLIDPNLMAFAFILDFPLFEWNEEIKRWDPMHHPFTAPVEADIPLLEKAPARVRARHYDIVCNGFEIAGGSVRIDNRELQERVFFLLGYRKEEIEERFGHLLEALEYGAPPHAGIAVGMDRLIMLLVGEKSLREVIAFPKNQNAADVMFGAPSPVTQQQLEELQLKLASEEVKTSTQ